MNTCGWPQQSQQNKITRGKIEYSIICIMVIKYIYVVNKKGVSCTKQGVSTWTKIAFLFRCS